MHRLLLICAMACAVLVPTALTEAQPAAPAEPASAPPGTTRTEDFSSGSGWGGRNNRRTDCVGRRQDFGYTDSDFSGLNNERIGGSLTSSYDRSYYARAINDRTLNSVLEAEGRVRVSDADEAAIRMGYFSTAAGDSVNDSTLPNSFQMVIGDVRGGDDDEVSFEMEFTTSKGARISLFARDQKKGEGDADNNGNDVDDDGNLEYDGKDAVRDPGEAVGYNKDETHTWKLRYDPGDGPYGSASLQINDDVPIKAFLPRHMREDGLRVDHFGLSNHAHLEGGEDATAYFDNIEIDGSNEGDDNLRNDWRGHRNRDDVRTCETPEDFSFGLNPGSPWAGGLMTGPELQDWDADGIDRYLANNSAYYADRLPSPLNLEVPLHASGNLLLARHGQDMESFIGFFNDRSIQIKKEDENKAGPDMKSFVGFKLEGPRGPVITTAARPSYGSVDASADNGRSGTHEGYVGERPRRFPTRIPVGVVKHFELRYNPNEGEGAHGRVWLRVDGGEWIHEDLSEDARKDGAQLNYFGIHTADAASIARQYLYLAQPTYTYRAPAAAPPQTKGAADTSSRARIVSLTWRRNPRGVRALRARLDLDERMRTASVRLVRHGRMIASKRVRNLRRGTRTVTLSVRRRVKRGPATLRIALRDTSSNVKQVRRRVGVPRKLSHRR